jgi:hypothetical protein
MQKNVETNRSGMSILIELAGLIELDGGVLLLK